MINHFNPFFSFIGGGIEGVSTEDVSSRPILASSIVLPSGARYLMTGKIIYETNFYVTALGIKRGADKIVYSIFSNDYTGFF